MISMKPKLTKPKFPDGPSFQRRTKPAVKKSSKGKSGY